MAWFEGDPDPVWDAAAESAEHWHKQSMKKREEKISDEIIFSYPAVISHVDHLNAKVIVIVSVNGKNMTLSAPTSYFKFVLKENLKIVVEGVIYGEEKRLEFRKIVPLVLDAEHEAMLVDFLASFKKI